MLTYGVQFLILTLGDAKQSTSTVYKSLNPEWNQELDFPIVDIQSLVLDAVCWDKDRFGKDYMGEFNIALEDVFADKQITQEVRPNNGIIEEESSVDANSRLSLDGIRWDRDALERRAVLSLAQFNCNSLSPTPPIRQQHPNKSWRSFSASSATAT